MVGFLPQREFLVVEKCVEWWKFFLAMMAAAERCFSTRSGVMPCCRPERLEFGVIPRVEVKGASANDVGSGPKSTRGLCLRLAKT